MKTAIAFIQGLVPAVCVLLIPLFSFFDQRLPPCELMLFIVYSKW